MKIQTIKYLLPEARLRRLSTARARSRGWPILTLESDHLAERTHVKELVALLEQIAETASTPPRAHE